MGVRVAADRASGHFPNELKSGKNYHSTWGPFSLVELSILLKNGRNALTTRKIRPLFAAISIMMHRRARLEAV